MDKAKIKILVVDDEQGLCAGIQEALRREGYVVDATTDPTHPRLMREVNFNPPQLVAETLENLQFTYNFVDGTTPPPVNQSDVPAGDNENQIRSVNVYLGARSTSVSSANMHYARTNLSTQVALRSMAYFNTYQ